MIRVIVGFIVVVALASSASAQLSAGDIVLTGYNSDNPDEFSFVALVPITANEEIRFTDNGWQINGMFRAGEGEAVWTADVSIPAGTEIIIEGTTASAGTVSSNSLQLAGAGDQLFAFQGSIGSPTLLSGLQMNGDWDADATSSNSSSLPSALTDFDTAMAIAPEIDNAVVSCPTGIIAGTPAQIRTYVYLHVGDNWNKDDDNRVTLGGNCTFLLAPDTCGDGNDTCDAGETQTNCPADCSITSTFDGNDLEDWGNGQGTGISQVLDAGLDGASDHVLESVSDGTGNGGKQVIWNNNAWAGNFTAIEITDLYFLANNTGANDVELRIIVEGPPQGNRGPMAISTVGQRLVAGSGWTAMSFPIEAGDLTGIGNGDPATILANVAKVRIVHATSTAGAENIVSTVQYDDISTLPLTPVCGDNVKNGTDACDGGDLDGRTCTDEGYVNPDGLVCSMTCDAFDTSACVSVCGNSTTEPGEDCDEGVTTDTQTCDGDCTTVTCGDGYCNAAAEDQNSCAQDCGMCSNNTAEGNEVCDGTDLRGQDCTNFGYVAGAGLACDANCDSYDTSGCMAMCGNNSSEPGEDCDEGTSDTATCDGDCTTVSCGDSRCNAAANEDAVTCSADCPTTCSDTLITGNEVCDGNNLDGMDCSDFGYVETAGLACANDCLAFDTSGCSATCGNSTSEPGEDCDEGVTTDTATCDGDCSTVTCGDGRCNAAANETMATCPADCGAANTCGDNDIGGDEVCDGTDLDGQTCRDFGYAQPNGLSCASDCESFIQSGCTNVCGNAMVEPGEQCDDGNIVDGDGCSSACAPEGCFDENGQPCAVGGGSSCSAGTGPAGLLMVLVLLYGCLRSRASARVTAR